MSEGAARILVIKHGALGDFVQALGPASAVRSHHPGARITLLTTALFADFARQSGYFDEVWIDRRAPFWALSGWLGLRRRLRAGRFDRVYDLQTSDRTDFYHLMLGPGRRPEWSGTARFCSHPDRNPERSRSHTIERQSSQLRDAGIASVPLPDLGWVEADIGRFALPGRYLLLVPGGAAHRPGKRWPVADYAAIATRAAASGIAPVLIGAAAEADIMDAIADVEPSVRNLAGETSFADIVALARGAVAAVGNDTGPMHLVAGAGCPSVVLFSHESDPARCAQRAPPGAPEPIILRRPDLARLAVDEVWAALKPSLSPGLEDGRQLSDDGETRGNYRR